MSRDKRDAEQAASRAQRLAKRADDRARRKQRHAERAVERSERLADREKRRAGRAKKLDRSIEDLVDKVAHKAAQWIDDQARRVFDSPDERRETKRAALAAVKAKRDAEKARNTADQASRAAEELSQYEKSLGPDSGFDDLFEDVEQPRRRSSARVRDARRKTRGEGEGLGFAWSYYAWPRSRSRARRRKSAHLYRDRQRKKICGVCAGMADYVGRPVWEVRLYALLGLIFIPSVLIPSYFIGYFFMGDQPYYRHVTDRFEDGVDSQDRERDDRSSEKRHRSDGRQPPGSNQQPDMSNVQAMKTAKDKFFDIEQRLRQMEGYVTSSRFELQREFHKISAES